MYRFQMIHRPAKLHSSDARLIAFFAGRFYREVFLEKCQEIARYRIHTFFSVQTVTQSSTDKKLLPISTKRRIELIRKFCSVVDEYHFSISTIDGIHGNGEPNEISFRCIRPAEPQRESSYPPCNIHGALKERYRYSTGVEPRRGSLVQISRLLFERLN